ncbi:MAG: SIMPL domain-containing protein, partial [Candidatus Binataceae bacterium]
GAASPAPEAANSSRRTIEVNGHGEVRAEPDAAQLSFAIETKAKTADQTAQLNRAAANRLMAVLRAKTANTAEPETQGYSVTPLDTDGGNPILKVTGYSASGDVAVETPDAAMVAVIMQTAIDAGIDANGIRAASSEQLGRPPGRNRVEIGLRAYGSTPTECTRRYETQRQKLLSALKTKLKDKDLISEANFSITPKQEVDHREYTGFRGFNSIALETTDVNHVGELVDTALAAGATSVISVSFTLRDDLRAKNRAIEAASQDARMKAQTLAKSMGVKLKGVRKLSTLPQVRPASVSGFGGGAYASSSVLHQSTQTLPRKVLVTADVTATYDID